MFDGDLINNIASDGLISPGVVWAFVTVAVGLLAALRTSQLYLLR
jgi:hypothetical protein